MTREEAAPAQGVRGSAQSVGTNEAPDSSVSRERSGRGPSRSRRGRPSPALRPECCLRADDPPVALTVHSAGLFPGTDEFDAAVAALVSRARLDESSFGVTPNSSRTRRQLPRCALESRVRSTSSGSSGPMRAACTIMPTPRPAGASTLSNSRGRRLSGCTGLSGRDPCLPEGRRSAPHVSRRRGWPHLPPDREADGLREAPMTRDGRSPARMVGGGR